MICSSEKKTRSYPTRTPTVKDKKKKSTPAFKDPEVAEKDCSSGCFDSEDHFKTEEGKNNRVLSFLKNASGTTCSVPQKGGRQLRLFFFLNAIKMTAHVI